MRFTFVKQARVPLLPSRTWPRHGKFDTISVFNINTHFSTAAARQDASRRGFDAMAPFGLQVVFSIIENVHCVGDGAATTKEIINVRAHRERNVIRPEAI